MGLGLESQTDFLVSYLTCVNQFSRMRKENQANQINSFIPLNQTMSVMELPQQELKTINHTLMMLINQVNMQTNMPPL